jgi:squalene-hopene/tetraprenyl-beta-curcumene cyclase
MTVTEARPGSTVPASVTDVARDALSRATEHVLGLQHEQGWWQGELETNVTMDAEDLLLREFLGIRTKAETDAAARWIRAKQREDGTWANFYGGPGNLSTTVEAYVALRLAGDSPEAPHMAIAAEWIRASGGLEATRVFTRIWMALFGEWPWDELPVIPPEIIYLPSWVPLNIYDWGCWARQTIVALAVVASMRPVRALPFTIPELRTGVTPASKQWDPWAITFGTLDKLLQRYEQRGSNKGRSSKGRSNNKRRSVGRAVRRAALQRCAEWIIARQERDGCWGGIQPPWVYSLMALHLLGYRLDHPVMARGLAGLDKFTITEDTPEGPVRRLEACQSPVWDTVLTMIGLADAGLPADHPALVKAASWVLAEEVPGPGDWQVRRPGLTPGGWSFEFDNDIYPDTDDTAEVLLALRRVALPSNPRPTPTVPTTSAAPPPTTSPDLYAETVAIATVSAYKTSRHPAVERGLRWLVGMQCKDGGWGAFDADNTRQIVTKLPFCDFGAVIDPPSADVTAHIVEALAAEDRREDPEAEQAMRRGVTWLLRAQEADGSWFGRWGANYVYGTGAVVPALIAAGVLPSKPSIRRAVEWLKAHQNRDGGWGEDLRSYDDPGWAGQGESTASQTAWALLALLAAGERDTVDTDRSSVTGRKIEAGGASETAAPAAGGLVVDSPAAGGLVVDSTVERGVRWLADTQRDDGSWDEPQFTGTGFPGDFYINYHMYRLAFPVSALGRYVGGTK